MTTPKSPLNLINKSIKSEQLNEIERLMKIVNLAQKVDSKAGSLSHGQKQWLTKFHIKFRNIGPPPTLL